VIISFFPQDAAFLFLLISALYGWWAYIHFIDFIKIKKRKLYRAAMDASCIHAGFLLFFILHYL